MKQTQQMNIIQQGGNPHNIHVSETLVKYKFNPFLLQHGSEMYCNVSSYHSIGWATHAFTYRHER